MDFVLETVAVSLMQRKEIDVVLIDAFGIAQNGDTMAQHGSLALAIGAQHFQIPLYGVTRQPILDIQAATGQDLEEPALDMHSKFDIISSSLIDAIITEKGTIRRVGKEFDLQSFFQHGCKMAVSSQFSTFCILDEESVKDYIKANPSLSQLLGPDSTKWTSRESGDGNINYVYIIEGPKGSLVVKQALSYIRCVGESWPLTQVIEYPLPTHF